MRAARQKHSAVPRAEARPSGAEARPNGGARAGGEAARTTSEVLGRADEDVHALQQLDVLLE
eukprot:3943085-Prymnesium_polylepis.2